MSDKPTLESRSFLEQATVGIVHATPEGHILRCNAEFADIIGYPREEVRGLMMQEITPDEDGAVPHILPETMDRGQRCTEP